MSLQWNERQHLENIKDNVYGLYNLRNRLLNLGYDQTENGRHMLVEINDTIDEKQGIKTLRSGIVKR